MNSFKRALLDIVFIFLITTNNCSSETMAARKALKDKLLNGYDKLIRPTEEGNKTTSVLTELVPRQVIEVDDDRSLLVMDSYLFLTWIDSRLKWNRTLDYSGKYLPLPPDLLWLPDISIYNSHSLSVNPTQDILVQVMFSGRVIWFPPILTQTSCWHTMDSTYPYDELECDIVLGAWAHDGWEIDYEHGILWWGFFGNINPRWEVIISKSRTDHRKTTYNESHNPYRSLNFLFSLKRRSLPEIEVMRSPCILVMLLTLSVFWLPPASTKKLHLLGILLLVLTVLLIYVACNTKYPLGVLASVSFLQSTLCIVVATFLFQVLVIYNLCSLTGPARPPAIAIQLLTGPFGKYTCLHWPFRDDSLQLYRVQVIEENSTATKNSPSPNDDWLLFAAGLDKLFFVLVSVSMIAVHHL